MEFNPRVVVGMVQRGLIDEVLRSGVIWMCALCLKCKERCPSGVAPCDIIQELRNIAVERGMAFPEGYSVLMLSVLEQGMIQAPQEVATRQMKLVDRGKLGLPDTASPSDISKFSKALERVME